MQNVYTITIYIKLIKCCFDGIFNNCRQICQICSFFMLVTLLAFSMKDKAAAACQAASATSVSFCFHVERQLTADKVKRW